LHCRSGPPSALARDGTWIGRAVYVHDRVGSGPAILRCRLPLPSANARVDTRIGRAVTAVGRVGSSPAVLRCRLPLLNITARVRVGRALADQGCTGNRCTILCLGLPRHSPAVRGGVRRANFVYQVFVAEIRVGLVHWHHRTPHGSTYSPNSPFDCRPRSRK
jgi:hypothetical protein